MKAIVKTVVIKSPEYGIEIKNFISKLLKNNLLLFLPNNLSDQNCY